MYWSVLQAILCSSLYYRPSVRATLSLAQGVETSGGIRSINMGTIIQEQEYYAPSGGIQREERMRIPMLGETLYTKW
jgi:hypothetical protein